MGFVSAAMRKLALLLTAAQQLLLLGPLGPHPQREVPSTSLGRIFQLSDGHRARKMSLCADSWGFLTSLNIFFYCVCLFVSGGFESTTVPTWGSDSSPRELTLSFCHEGPRSSGHQAWKQAPFAHRAISTALITQPHTLLSHVAKSIGGPP